MIQYSDLKQLRALADNLYTGLPVWRSFYTADDAQIVEDMRTKTIAITDHLKVGVYLRLKSVVLSIHV